MNEIRREKTLVSQLDIGMFVCELDRPWLGTPFLLEGLLLEEEAQVQTLTSLCEFVYIDRTFSVGHHYHAPPKVDVATKHVSHPAIATKTVSNVKPITANNAHNKFSFFEILKEVKASNQKTSPSTKPGESVLFNANIIEERPLVEEEIAIIFPAYEKTQIATRAFFESIAMDQQIDLSKVDDALSEMVESIERNPDALIWLAKLKQSDDYSYNHALNVSITLMALGTFMSLPKKKIKDLGLSGLLQDIGKVKIPSELLKKEEKLTLKCLF